MSWALFLLATVSLSPSLTTWKEAIEKTGKIAVVLLRLPATAQTAMLVLPADTPEREALANYTDQPGFVSQYRGAQAMTVNYLGPKGRVSFVLVNPEHAGTGAAEEAVIAHEFGHIWLKAQRYPAPAYAGGDTACLSVHALDAVQHILIREEMERRGVEWKAPWYAALGAALAQMESEPGAAARAGRCQRLGQAAMWIDVALGAGDWGRQRDFLAAMRRRFPEMVPTAEEITAYLRSAGVEDVGRHRAALSFVFGRMKQLALAVPL